MNDERISFVSGIPFKKFRIINPYMRQHRPHKDEVSFIKITYMITDHSSPRTFLYKNQLVMLMVMPGSRKERTFLPKHDKRFCKILWQIEFDCFHVESLILLRSV